MSVGRELAHRRRRDPVLLLRARWKTVRPRARARRRRRRRDHGRATCADSGAARPRSVRAESDQVSVANSTNSSSRLPARAESAMSTRTSATLHLGLDHVAVRGYARLSDRRGIHRRAAQSSVHRRPSCTSTSRAPSPREDAAGAAVERLLKRGRRYKITASSPWGDGKSLGNQIGERLGAARARRISGVEAPRGRDHDPPPAGSPQCRAHGLYGAKKARSCADDAKFHVRCHKTMEEQRLSRDLPGARTRTRDHVR